MARKYTARQRGACVVLVTAANANQARRIARALLEEKRAACVTIVPNAQSRYWWQGRIETAKELVLIIKTARQSVTRVIETVKRIHSYRVPEIIALPIVDGNQEYLDWLHGSLCSPRASSK